MRGRTGAQGGGHRSRPGGLAGCPRRRDMPPGAGASLQTRTRTRAESLLAACLGAAARKDTRGQCSLLAGPPRQPRANDGRQRACAVNGPASSKPSRLASPSQARIKWSKSMLMLQGNQLALPGPVVRALRARIRPHGARHTPRHSPRVRGRAAPFWGPRPRRRGHRWGAGTSGFEAPCSATGETHATPDRGCRRGFVLTVRLQVHGERAWAAGGRGRL